jgi:hypothetical protein
VLVCPAEIVTALLNLAEFKEQCCSSASSFLLPHHTKKIFTCVCFAVSGIAAEIVTALLNLAEFMEHDDKRLPLDTRTLGALAEKCHAFAKVGRFDIRQ